MMEREGQGGSSAQLGTYSTQVGDADCRIHTPPVCFSTEHKRAGHTAQHAADKQRVRIHPITHVPLWIITRNYYSILYVNF